MIIMFQVILLAVVVLAVGSVADTSDCLKLAVRSLKCCTNPPKLKPVSDDAKQCLALFKPGTCELDTCIAKKYGYAGAEDGTFDVEKLTARVKDEAEAVPDLGAQVITKCINGDLSNYGPLDLCNLGKFKNCIALQVAKSCTEWNTTGECSNVKDIENCD